MPKKKPKAKRARGRPSLLNLEVTEKIVDCLRVGSYIETAVAFAGINKDTFYAWLKRGAKETKGPYREFSDAIEKALAEGELDHIKRINEASKTEWQASAWMLERKFPKRWGRRTEVELGPNATQKSKDISTWIADVLAKK